MRTKTLILTAAFVAAGIASSMAQATVYSVNAVGYVNLDILGSGAGKYSLIANPLNAPVNNLRALINPTTAPAIPFSINALKWKEGSQNFRVATFVFGDWDTGSPDGDDGLISLNPGEGIFILTDTPFKITFVGEVMQGSLANSAPAGLSVRASQVPQNGNADSLSLSDDFQGFANDVQKWNYANQSFDIWTYFFGGWSGPGGVTTPPPIAIGEAVFLSLDTATSWNRSFQVSP